MDKKQFQEYLEVLESEVKGKDIRVIEKKLKTMLPVLSFREYERMLVFLRDGFAITVQQYESSRKDYLGLNKYLIVYGIGSRLFGEIWAIQQLKSLDNRFKEPAKSFELSYVRQYDLLFEGARLGAKACRAVDMQEEGDRFAKALRYDSQKPLVMNFRELRTDACDIFVFIGVWVDQLVYWVLSNQEIKQNKYLVHDKTNTQDYILRIDNNNISDFDKYKVLESEVIKVIINKRAT
jgi:hypothetical protein